jgi:hypothetical protein
MRRRGSILVEIVIASGLAFLLLAVCLRMLSATANQRRLIERRAIALQEATNLLERATAIPYEQLDAQRLAELKLPDEAKQLMPGAEETYTVDVEQQPVQAKRVAVELRWKGDGGRPEAPIRLVRWYYPPPADSETPPTSADSPPSEKVSNETNPEPAGDPPAPADLTEPAP